MGLPEVIDFGHPCPMTFLCSLPSHQELLLLRGKGNANGVAGRVVFLTETHRGSEQKEADLHSTFLELDTFPTRAEKGKFSVKKNADLFFSVLLECLAAALIHTGHRTVGSANAKSHEGKSFIIIS